jgi:hypothetical protein
MGLPALRHTFARSGAIRDHGMDVLLLRTASLLQSPRCIVDDDVGIEHVRHCVTPGYGTNARFTKAMVTDTIVVASSHPGSTSLGQIRPRLGAAAPDQQRHPARADHQQPPYQHVSERQREHRSGENDEH